MKKFLLSALMAGACMALHAQPTLTAATNNPTAGEVFYGRYVDVASIDTGAAGAGVTWNFAAITVNDSDTTTYFNCAATPYCDSFAGINIVMYDGYDYYYGVTSTSGYQYLGAVSGGVPGHFTNPMDVMYYPLTYHTAHLDTSTAKVTEMGVDIYINVYDSSLCDAYGTLILPTGTYTNALRVHTIEVFKDSVDIPGMPQVDEYRTDIYTWYAAGFHNKIVSITYDTSGATAPYKSDAEYYWHVAPPPPNAVGGLSTNASGLNLFPNPAGNTLNASFNVTDNSTEIVITDMTSRVVKNVNAADLKAGRNELAISVADMADGLYIFQLRTATGVQSQKINIRK